MPTPKKVYVFLVIGLLAASQSGNLIRIGDAHPVAIAAWRLLIASVLLAPLAGSKLRDLRKLTKVEIGLLLAAGVFMALHFFTWIAAVQMTKVANAAMFFSINPVITATAGFFIYKERVSPRLVISIALGLLGIAVIGWSDISFSPDDINGDVVAVVCSFLFSAYFLIGKTIRKKLDTAVYSTSVYGIAAVFGFSTMFVLELPIVEYSRQTWLCFVLMALIPTLIGHTSFNNALKYIDAGRISAATVSEPLMAGLVAYFAWDEALSVGAFVGYILICSSVLVLFSDEIKRRGANTFA